MTPPWTADIELHEHQAAALIAAQFPELRGLALEPFGIGWDNQAWLVGGTWVFRFPRRHIAAALVASEIRHLPALAPRLPLPVPVPVYAGHPAGDYPYPFVGYRLLPGTTACSPAISAAERARTARPLGAFLRCLHRIPVAPDTAASAPGDDIGRSNLSMYMQRLAPHLRALERAPGIDTAALRAHIDRLSRTPPWPGPPCWVHGDLYARHLLLDQARAPCGVIDWGDVHLGDPALDLSIAFSFLSPGARDDFWASYGPVDQSTAARARLRALSYGIILVNYGRSVSDDALAHAGALALTLALDHAPPAATTV